MMREADVSCNEGCDRKQHGGYKGPKEQLTQPGLGLRVGWGVGSS